MASRLSFDFAPRGGARKRRDEEATRILIIANLSGDARRSEPPGLAHAHVRAVSVENFDAVLRSVRPQAVIPNLHDDNARAVVFEAWEDFHPDQLYGAVASSLEARPARVASSPAGPAPAQAHDGASALERLLGGKPAFAAPAPARPNSGLDHILRELVAPHVVQAATRAQTQAQVDDSTAIADEMRRVLHAPSFQRVEAAWRGVRWLVCESPLGAALEVCVLDASRADVLADLRACAGDLERSQLYRAVVREATASPGATPFSLVVGDFSFEGSEEDVSLLAGLGAVAGYAGGCFLGAAEPALWGCRDLEREPERGFWSQLDPALGVRMAALRESAVAPFIGLCMPRVLGRVPYGAKTDPIERFAFEELPPDPAHAAFLWINGAFAAAQLILAGVAEQGWESGPGSQLELSDLPHVVYRAHDGTAIKPCAEVYLDETSAKHVLGCGVMPFMSYRNRNAVRLLRLQSIAQPAAALALHTAGS